MELVYLWVEEYKNIHRQGFNFSARFRCDYNPKTNELTIEENDDYIPNFFGENINITAIVGKNGSGKSSVLEILSNLNGNYKVLIKYNDIFYTNFHLNNENKEKYEIETLYYLDDFKIFQKLLTCKLDSEPKKCEFLTIAEAIQYNNTIFDILNENFVFKYWKVNINNTHLPIFKTGLEDLDNKLNSVFYEPLKKLSYLEIFSYVAIRLIIYVLAGKPIDETQYLALLNKLVSNFNKENYLNLVNAIDLEKFTNIGNYNKILKTLQNYDESIEYLNQFLENREINSKDIRSFTQSGIYITLHNFSKNNFEHSIVDLDYLSEKKLSYLELSDGEQRRIINIALIVEHLIKDEDDTNLYLSLIDEPDTYLHPNWQKILIHDIIKLVNKFSYKNIHIIITTHSPFLLSDIPKQNIIFLDTDKDGKCKVVDGLKEKKQTFGANIHTLLSDSFFMEGGLMGEFAKSKINEIIDFHNIVSKNRHKKCLENIYLKSKKEKFWQTQSIIGEDYLKQIVKNHLIDIEKILLREDKAKEEEIKRVKEYLKSLEND